MKFSIVVSTFNRAEKLRQCVESVLAQTYKDYELIVVDDGSTDSTAEMMRGYSTNPQVRFIELGKNYGSATMARNTGIEAMTGDALIIWDSDDEFYPHALEELAEAHAKMPQAVAVCACTDWMRDDVNERVDRGPSREVSYIDWYCGKRPKEAEIISIRREYIGDTRFRSKGIDFMFYFEILGRSKAQTYYIDRPCGKIILESDALSLTLARKKPNKARSIERGPVIAKFLEEYGHIYTEHCPKRFAPHAYGAAMGLLLGNRAAEARTIAFKGLQHAFSARLLALYVLAWIPGGPSLIARFF